MTPALSVTLEHPRSAVVGERVRVQVHGVMLPWAVEPLTYICRCFLTGDDYLVEEAAPSLTLNNTGKHVSAEFWATANRPDADPSTSWF